MEHVSSPRCDYRSHFRTLFQHKEDREKECGRKEIIHKRLERKSAGVCRTDRNGASKSAGWRVRDETQSGRI